MLHDGCRMVKGCYEQAVRAVASNDACHRVRRACCYPCRRLSSTPTSVGRNTRVGSAGATMARALGLASSGCDARPPSVAMASASSSTSCSAVRQLAMVAMARCSGSPACGSTAGHNVHSKMCSGAPQGDDAGWQPNLLAAPQLQRTAAQGAARTQSPQCGQRCGSGPQWWTRRLQSQQHVAAIALTYKMARVASRRRSCQVNSRAHTCCLGRSTRWWAKQLNALHVSRVSKLWHGV